MESRISEFQKMSYGMFIHYGLYSQLGCGEWVMDRRPIPFGEYKKLKDRFTASDFSGREIAKLARLFGMKYICLTTRHHDGFSLYDTRGLNDFDAPHSPAGRDLIEDFVSGCRAEGIIPFFYHTTLDWSQPCFETDFNAYLDYLNKSVEILCRNYGRIGGFWFDGNWSKPNADWKEDVFYGMIRKYQPDAIIVNNTGLNARGQTGHPEIDVVTYERGRPDSLPAACQDGRRIAAEMCLTMNQHWGIAKNDFRFVSPKDLVEDLCACRKVNANLLLNVGPTAEGRIGDYEMAALKIVGHWVALYADILCCGQPCHVQTESDKDFVLQYNRDYYVFIHDLPISGDENVSLNKSVKGWVKLTGVEGKIKEAVWIDNAAELEFRQDMAAKTAEFQATHYHYGTDLVVRVAKIKMA